MQTEILNLDQLLADPLIRLVMSSDGIGDADVREVMRRARRKTQCAKRPNGDYH